MSLPLLLVCRVLPACWFLLLYVDDFPTSLPARFSAYRLSRGRNPAKTFPPLPVCLHLGPKPCCRTVMCGILLTGRIYVCYDPDHEYFTLWLCLMCYTCSLPGEDAVLCLFSVAGVGYGTDGTTSKCPFGSLWPSLFSRLQTWLCLCVPHAGMTKSQKTKKIESDLSRLVHCILCISFL